MTLLKCKRSAVATIVIDYRRTIIDAALILVGLGVTFWLSATYGLYEKLGTFIESHNGFEFDEGVIVTLAAVVGLVLFGARRMQDQRREIKARQRAEDRVKQMAMADMLTGLPNRRQFEARMRSALSGMVHDGKRYALMMLDLDRFKPVNDVFGHVVGDEVLIAFAQRTAAVMGEGIVARFGGDEFAAFIGPISDLEEPTRLARRMVAAVSRPFDAGGTQISIGVSIGIAIAPQDGVAPEDLLRRADIALYRAKRAGRGAFRFFEEEMDTEVKRRARIERDLRQAIDDGTVRPHYQPIVDLATNAIIGFEALARWEHPLLGPIEPPTFIGIAEDAGLITKLAEHLLRAACIDALAWPSNVKLAFNVSRLQLADPMLVLRVLQVLGETGFSPTRLEIEISEDALVSELDAAKEALAAFHSAGIRIALDDFGTGNSSLRHLREVPFDRLKIDKSFVTSMNESADSALIVNAILDLSKALGMPVTAEGIESEDVIGPLRAHGCSEGQGYNFSRAVPASAALEMLAVGHAAAPVVKALAS